MGRRCNYDDSHLRKVVTCPQEFPYKTQIMRVFEKYGYYNEEIAFKVSKIRKWDDDAQQARYVQLADAVSLVPYLAEMDATKNSDSPFAKDTVKLFIGASVDRYLFKEFGKWHCENYKSIYSCLRDKHTLDDQRVPILRPDGSVAMYSGGALRRITKEEYDAYIAELKAGNKRKSLFTENEWLYLMDTFIVELNGNSFADYSKVEPKAFKIAVEQAYNFIVKHEADIRNDKALMSQEPSFTTTRMVDAILYERIKGILAQKGAKYSQVRKQLTEAVNASFFFHRLPGLLSEYQEWALFHEGEHTAYINRVENALIQWRSDEYSHVSKWLVAQYLYFVLTGELIAAEGNVPMPIACVIDEILRLFGYLEEVDDEANIPTRDANGHQLPPEQIASMIRKRRRDRIKMYFKTDPVTKEYIRLR